MAALENIARAALDREDLLARQLVLEFEQAGGDLAAAPEPLTDDLRVRTMAAAIAALFAERKGRQPPQWVANVGEFPEGFYTSSFATPGSLTRANLERETPKVLKPFGVFASPDYLRSV